MNWIILSTIVTLLASIAGGNKRLFYLYQLTIRRLSIGLLISVSVYSLMLWLFKTEVLSEAVAGAVTANVYASIAGFFLGSSAKQYNLKRKSGDLMYLNRTFLSEYAPAIIGIGLITFGVYRSALFSDIPMTPIRVTSGLSLVSIGLWGFTLRVVPEFRKKGIILIDRLISWDDFLSYTWHTEEVVELEFSEDDSLKAFHAIIPPEDQVRFEDVIRTIMIDKSEQDEDQE